jgi:hypothetical protein
MKKLLLLIVLAGFVMPHCDTEANSDTVHIELATLYFVKNHCERKMLKCFGDRTLAKALVREIKTVPLYEVEQICRDICTSPSEIRWSRFCSDAECYDRCEVTGGLDDEYFMEKIQMHAYDDLRIICY